MDSQTETAPHILLLRLSDAVELIEEAAMELVNVEPDYNDARACIALAMDTIQELEEEMAS